MLEFSDVTQPDELEVLSEGPINIPEDSVVDTESSDGQGHVYEDESDGDHEKDKDYVMDNASDKSDSDEEFNIDVQREVHHEPMKGKGKMTKVSCLYLVISHCDTKTCQNLPKSQKGNFCRDINNACTNSAIAGNTAINSIAKMKSLTSQKQKSPWVKINLGEFPQIQYKYLTNIFFMFQRLCYQETCQKG